MFAALLRLSTGNQNQTQNDPSQTGISVSLTIFLASFTILTGQGIYNY